MLENDKLNFITFCVDFAEFEYSDQNLHTNDQF
jgi:hypothetical protein